MHLIEVLNQVLKQLILITDGEDHMGRAVEMAKLAKKEGVIIYAIGLGNETGGFIPTASGYKQSPSGGNILSKPNFAQLKEIAKYYWRHLY